MGIKKGVFYLKEQDLNILSLIDGQCLSDLSKLIDNISYSNLSLKIKRYEEFGLIGVTRYQRAKYICLTEAGNLFVKAWGCLNK
jgi:DNA-binding HxlR family transcriptional regulator